MFYDHYFLLCVVHDLSPGYVEVVAALGDSVTVSLTDSEEHAWPE